MPVTEEIEMLSSGSDVESENSDVNKNNKEDDVVEGNPKLADAMAKVLRMAGKIKGKTLILSKAKLHTSKKPIKDEGPTFEVDNAVEKVAETDKASEDVKVESQDIKPDSKELVKYQRITRREVLNRGRLKPSVLDKEKEKPLLKTATKGVVQLFNALRQQQLKINNKLQEQGITEVKKDKILRAVDKSEFLNMLMKPGPNKEKTLLKSEDEDATFEIKSEPEDDGVDREVTEPEPTWEVLKNDFMMGAKLKDWDKQAENTEAETHPKVKKRKTR